MIKRYSFFSKILLLLCFSQVVAEDLKVTNDTDFYVEMRQKDVFSCKEIVYRIKPRVRESVIQVEKDKPLECAVLTYKGAEEDSGCCLFFNDITYLSQFFITLHQGSSKKNRSDPKIIVSSNTFLVRGEILLEEFEKEIEILTGLYEIFDTVKSFWEFHDFTVLVTDFAEKSREYSQAEFNKLDLAELFESDSTCCSPLGFFTGWFPLDTKSE